MTPIRILHILTALNRGGIETMLMNYYSNIDREKVQFDFLVHRNGRFEYSEMIEKLGGKIFHVPPYNPYSLKYRRSFTTFFNEHPEYQIVHCHLNCLSGLPLKEAKTAGVKTRIAHSHIIINGWSPKEIYKRIAKHTIRFYTTDFFACSKEAGRWMFGNCETIIMPNAIDVQKFKYNEEIRNKMRKTITNKNEIIIGHVGRLTKQKNQSYLIHICELLRGKGIDYKMVFIGTGEDKDSLIQLVKKKHLEDSIIFKGSQDNVNEWMQAFDVFAFPSLYEGLGIVAIEAQTASLPTLCSENVPAEANISSNFIQVPLSNPGKWAEIISKIEPKSRIDTSQVALDAGYDIKSCAFEFQEFYIRKSSQE